MSYDARRFSIALGTGLLGGVIGRAIGLSTLGCLVLSVSLLLVASAFVPEGDR